MSIHGLAVVANNFHLFHEMGFAREVGHRVLFMDEGVIEEDAPPAQLFDHPQQARTRQFLSKVL